MLTWKRWGWPRQARAARSWPTASMAGTPGTTRSLAWMNINIVDRSVLFVFTANICRSPMAVALLRARVRKERPDWRQWRIDSAGTWAQDGAAAAKNSQLIMAERGLD